MPAIKEGGKAPGFTLEDSAGQRVSLGDFKGQDVVVYFYPRDDTPGCTKEACGFRDLAKELQRAGVVVLGVSADSPASHASFAAKYKLPFRLLSDPERTVMQAWGAWGAWQSIVFETTKDPAHAKQAVEAWQRAVELYPHSARRWARLSLAAAAAGDNETANRAAAEALRLDHLTPHEDQNLEPELREQMLERTDGGEPDVP